MAKLNVLVAINIGAELLELTRAVDPERLEVRALDRGERHAFRGSRDVAAGAAASLAAALGDAEVLVCDQTSVTPDLLERAPRLRWVQVTNAGIDDMVRRGVHRLPVIISNASGIHDANMAEYVFMMALAFTKRLHVYTRAQGRHEWSREQPEELAGKTIGIVGLGAIGRGIARKARAFDMRVVGARRGAGEELDPEVDRLYRPEQLEQMLAESDFVAIATPLTDATRHMIGEQQLRAMKSSAVVINIARGAIIDEAALIAALREGRIGGAGLDVFEEEPLPAGSPLWDMENVLITPHMSGNTPRYFELVIRLFCRSLPRFLAGEEPLNVIDVEAGY